MVKKKPEQARRRPDGEMYSRPWPNPFSRNWRDGYTDGYDGAGMRRPTDREYREGYQTGVDQREFDREEMDRSVSSN